MLSGMSDDVVFRPLSALSALGGGGSAQRARLVVATLEVVEVVAICDVEDVLTANVLPNIGMSIVQHIRLSDGSLVRLDMDRGVTSVRHGVNDGEPVSWKRPLDDLVKEILDLVHADDPANPMAHPWADLAAAARLRGIDVDAGTLSALPYRVLLTVEAVETFVD